MSNEETYFKGGGLAFLVAKACPVPESDIARWQLIDITYGIGAGQITFHLSKQHAIALAKKRIIEAVAKEQGLSPKVVKAFMEADESSE